jgi:hypothetical protein
LKPVVVQFPERSKTEFRFPTASKKRVEIVDPPVASSTVTATFVSTTTINVGDVSTPTPTLKSVEKRVKPPRIKEPTPMGVYDNPPSAEKRGANQGPML